MSNLDILVLIILSLGGWMGYKWGIVFMSFSLVGLILGVWVLFVYNTEIKNVIQFSDIDGFLYTLICIVVLSVALFIGKIASWFTEKILKIMFVNWINKSIGFIIGITVVWVFLSFAIVYSKSYSDIQTKTEGLFKDSKLATYLIATGNLLPGIERLHKIKDVIQEQLRSPEE